MAIIILTTYAIIITLLWGVALGDKAAQEKNNRLTQLVLKSLKDLLDRPLDITVDFDGAGLPHILGEMHKDMKANLQGTQAVVRAMSDIKDTARLVVADHAEPEIAPFEHPSEFFIHNLEYARDHIEDLQPRDKTMLQRIIDNLHKKHGK